MKPTVAAIGICLLGGAPDMPGAAGDSTLEARVQALEVPSLAPGARGELSLVLLETPEADLPLGVALESDAIELGHNRLDWRDVVDRQAAQLRVRGYFVAPAEPGVYEIRGRVAFVRCVGNWCSPRHATVSWMVTVAETDAP